MHGPVPVCLMLCKRKILIGKEEKKIVVVGAKNRIPESWCHRWAEVEKFNNFRESDIQ